MTSSISTHTMDIIKSTVPILQTHGEALTTLFYTKLFTNAPEVRPYFNHANQREGRQQQALANAILAYASNIDKLEALGPAVELIAHKHTSLAIQPEHYPIVGEHLLASIQELLGNAATPEILDAWAEAYGRLADIMMNRESQLYQKHVSHHGWKGFRNFQVTSRTQESDEITSFYLTPCDQSALEPHHPGQYITVRGPSSQGGTTMRNYSLSCEPRTSSYRISVKREQGENPGQISNWLHDTIKEGDTLEVGPPCGNFVLRLTPGTQDPLVFLAGGVGITPLVSMIHVAVKSAPHREIHLIQAARHGGVRAFAHELNEIEHTHPHFHHHVCYDNPRPQDLTAKDFNTHGRITQEVLTALLPSMKADFYFCGPHMFMSAVQQALVESGAEPTRMHHESFGPQLPL